MISCLQSRFLSSPGDLLGEETKPYLICRRKELEGHKKVMAWRCFSDLNECILE